MKKIEIKSIELSSYVKEMMSNGYLWQLVDRLIEEKWSSIDGSFKDGDISESLLKEIGRALSERAELKYKSGIAEIRDKDGNLFGYKRLSYET